MPGILHVVATPIGNLEDVTLRALRILREVALIAAEDTRRTARLLQHYSISTPTTSLHAHNEHSRTPVLIERLVTGESLALVSDAGTPVVSDPGARLVAAAHRAGIRVEAIPGPNAAVAALSVSGFEAEQFLFAGFPPSRGKARAEFFSRLTTETSVVILYEAPHRIRSTLEALLNVLGDRQMALAREITKLHEQLVIRPISDHLRMLGETRGEYTLVLGPAERGAAAVQDLNESAVAAEFEQLTKNAALPRRAILKQLASKHGMSTRACYQLIESRKRAVE